MSGRVWCHFGLLGWLNREELIGLEYRVRIRSVSSSPLTIGRRTGFFVKFDRLGVDVMGYRKECAPLSFLGTDSAGHR